MKQIMKYNLEDFEKKFNEKRHISCGINYADGDRDTMMNVSCSQILSYIRQTKKEVSYIAVAK